MIHALSDGMTIAAPGVAVSMTVSEDRQAGAHGVLGAGQSLTAGITAIIIGAVYEGSGRSLAYAVTAISMVVVVAIGMWLSAPFWRHGGHRFAPEPSVTN